MILRFRPYVRSAMVVLASAGFCAGCGPSTTPAAPTEAGGGLGEAGPNKRLGFKPEYKQMIGKNGELLKRRPAKTSKN